MIVPVDIIGVISPVMVVLVGVLMVVLRAGASRVYFDVVGTFQAARMLKDAQAMSTTMNSLMLDAFSGIEETAQILTEPIAAIVDELIPVTREVAEARIEFEKFVNEGENIEAIVNEVTELGHAFGFAADESLMAAARMAQLGGVLGPGMTGAGTEIGIKFGLISGMETEAAMQRMINLQQQTDFMTQGLEDNMSAEERAQKIRINSMAVLDQLNTVENRSAATMEQVTFVMNQFASQAHLTGESIAFMAAMSATLIEAGEEQGKGGRALRMIYARLGANTSGAADELHRLGVATHTADGELRPLSDILRDLDGALEGMGAAQLQATTQIVAGNRHYVRMIKLLENFDRVEQLALEATLAMSPAQEEVNRRLEANIVALDIAEAKLHDYSAAVGEALLPALTSATERQADFAKAFGSILTGSLGSAAESLVFFMQIMRSIGAPMLQTTVSLMQLNVATQTYQVLQRAIAGEELVREDFLGRLNQKTREGTESQQRMIETMQGYRQSLTEIKQEEFERLMQLRELTAEEARQMRQNLLNQRGIVEASEAALLKLRQKKNALTEEKIAQQKLTEEQAKAILRDRARAALGKEETLTHGMKIAAGKEVAKAIKEEGSAKKALSKDTQEALMLTNSEIQFIRDLNMTREEQNRIMRETLAMHYGDEIAEQLMNKRREEEADKLAMKENLEMMQARTLAMSKFSMGTMLAATASTMFVKGEKGARLAVVLSTMSMIPYISSIMSSSLATQNDTLQKNANVVATTRLAVANLFTKDTYVALGLAARSAAVAIASVAKATIVAGIIGFIIMKIAEAAGVFNDNFAEMNDNINNSPLLDATNIMNSFNDGLETSAMRLAEVTQELDVYRAAWGKAYEDDPNSLDTDIKAKMDALTKEELELTRAVELLEQKALLEGTNLDLIGGQVMAYRQAGATAAELQRQLDDQEQIWRSVESQNQMISFWQGIQQEALERSGKTAEELNRMFELGLISSEEIAATWQLISRIPDGTTSAIGGVTDELKDAEDALYNFNNAREELFFGFAASNVTGDLIKQVQRTGVENLVTNTEVIMTNNFNGMTTSEVADEILRQIESKAGSLSNISFS